MTEGGACLDGRSRRRLKMGWERDIQRRRSTWQQTRQTACPLMGTAQHAVVEVKVAPLQLLCLLLHPLNGGPGVGKEHGRRIKEVHILLIWSEAMSGGEILPIEGRCVIWGRRWSGLRRLGVVVMSRGQLCWQRGLL